MKPFRVGIVGVGKIARDQHIPAIRRSDAFVLAACANGCAPAEGVPAFPDLEAMLEGCPDLDAVAICAPPQAHFEAARLALRHGKHVLMEKPPCATTAQLDQLVLLARQMDRTLFQTWHTRHMAAVDAMQRWLKPCVIQKGRVVWKEDVRQWHPGQTWLWQAGGFGIFDAGINAVSILTKVVPEPIFVRSADLFIPTNCDMPIAAEVTLVTDAGAEIFAAFDFRHAGVPVWDIDLETDRGAVSLEAYRGALAVNAEQIAAGTAEAKYPLLYQHFAELIGRHESDVDKRPLQLVADAFLVGRRFQVEPLEMPWQELLVDGPAAH